MNIHLKINGTLTLVLFENGIEITDEKLLREINTKLDTAIYFVDLQRQVITDRSYITVLYTFKMEVSHIFKNDFELY